ncbi:MAG TPA: methyltransferase domain-containing protein [Bryobacteraceae bacterium]|nr:methyltransferase domain-containing protein [Bryobacteraceae bacterium]
MALEMDAAPELISALADERPGRALDLACGNGRHALWLAHRGWSVVAVDQVPADIPEVTFVQADIEKHEFCIARGEWDLIICWLYWQPDLLETIAKGVRLGGIVALAGKTSGRFATSLANYRAAFPRWRELAAGESGGRAWFISRAPLQ